MDHEIFFFFFVVEMRNVEGLDGSQGREQRFITTPAVAGAKVFPDLPQGAQHPRPIEPLSLAMIAVAHRNLLAPCEPQP